MEILKKNIHKQYKTSWKNKSVQHKIPEIEQE